MKNLVSPFKLSIKNLVEMSHKMRKSVFEVCQIAKNGHLGGNSGAVELLTVLYFGGILKYDIHNNKNPFRDRVLIRGHIGPLRYSIFSEIGYLKREELKLYRTIGSRLQGHEDHLLTPGVDIGPNGSLGMLLSYGTGIATVAKKENKDFKTFVFIGDGEEQEGNISEAARHAARLCLNNLIAIIDINGKQLSDPTHVTDSSDLKSIWQGYGWEVIELKKGNNVSSVKKAYNQALEKTRGNKPIVILAKTVKGIGLNGAKEHFSGYHTTSVCSDEIISKALENLPKSFSLNLKEHLSISGSDYISKEIIRDVTYPNLKCPPNIKSLGNGQVFYLKELSKRLDIKDNLFFITADVTRQDFVKDIQLHSFATYFNTGLREQHSIAFAHGISVTNPGARIIINTFDAFMLRGIDQLNALNSGKGNVIILGDYSGISNAKNGSTHQTVYQPEIIYSIPSIKFLEPWDCDDLFYSLNNALIQNIGVTYIRLHSGPIVAQENLIRHPNGYSVFNHKKDNRITFLTSGMTTNQCLEATELLNQKGISSCVISVVNHRSSNEALLKYLNPKNPVLCVYNGSKNFLYNQVANFSLKNKIIIPVVYSIGFTDGTSGSLNDLMKFYKLDTESIVKKAIKILSP
jgi:transketolase